MATELTGRVAELARTPIRVAIVEDQPLYRSMLVTLLSAEPDIEVVVVASGAAEARKAIRPGVVDVAILDVVLGDGNGLGLGVSLRKAEPELGILLLSNFDVMALLVDLPENEAKAWSYLSKTSSTSPAVLIDAVRQTAAGGNVLDAELVQRSTPRSGSALSTLSPRQYQVMQLVAQGLSNAAIAEKLSLSRRSVENHLNTIYAALNLGERSEKNLRVGAVLQFLEETSRV
jgi:DNA-binding NarL/FixJ family response regulator